MKQIPIYLVLFVLLMASCAKDESLVPGGGKEVAVHVSLSTAPMVDSNPSTRSTDTTTVDDSGIDNIWIFQFTTDGAFQKKLYLKPTDWSDFEVNLIAKGTSNLYFVANVGPDAFAADYAPTSIDSLGKKVVTESTCLYSGTGKMLIPMRGSLKNVTPSDEMLKVLKVKMVRLLARIDYTYTVDPALISSKGFMVKQIRLRNVSTTLPFDSVTAPVYPVTDSLKTVDFTYETGINNTTRTLTFYVPDNRRGTGTNATTDPRLKTGLAGATYLEMLGTTPDGSIYTFSVYPGADAYNNYTICANTHYAIAANVASLSPIDGRINKQVAAHPSNCYIVAPGGSVRIPVSRANESALGTQLADVTSGWTASIYWQTAAGLVTVSYNGAFEQPIGCFKVTAPSSTATGNAVVAVKDGSGNILWSWHIWVTDYNPAAENETRNNNVWMSRNLGATALANGSSTTFATCGGLMYQWGRKDPFPGSDGTTTVSPYKSLPIYDASGTLMTNTSLTWPTDGMPTATTGTTGDVVKIATVGTTAGTQIPYASQLSYSVKYPLLHLVNWAGSTATETAALTAVGGQSAWGGLYGESKSVYDPCPVGWRVPSFYKTATLTSPWSTWGTTQSLTTSAFAALKWDAASVFGTYYYPAAGNRNAGSGVLSSVGAFGYYWGASPNGTNVYSLYFFSDNVYTSSFSYSRGSSFGVRCVQE